MNNKFIVLEGIDGSGKSSIGKMFEEKHGIKFIQTPGKNLDLVRTYIETRDPLTRLLFYYAGNYDTGNTIRELLKTTSVVCDRYFYTTIIYFSIFNGCSLKDSLELMKNINEKMFFPDIVIYLKIPNEIRIERLMKRGGEQKITDKYFLKHLDRCKKAEELYMELMHHMSDKVQNCIIDSSGTVDETCRLILEKLDDLKIKDNNENEFSLVRKVK